MSDVVLELKNIYKDYRQGKSTISVLEDINMKVYAGQMLAIIGSSGKGKSTLLHIAGLLDKPTKGSVTISGFEGNLSDNLKKSHLIRLKEIGFIYQYHHLQQDFTAQENVAMPLLIAGNSQSQSMSRAATMLEELGLGNRLYHLPGELSGGQQQRVAIGRALVIEPKIIIADEPTGNLDPITADEVFQLLLNQAKEKNTSVIMASHNMQLAQRMDTIYKL